MPYLPCSPAGFYKSSETECTACPAGTYNPSDTVSPVKNDITACLCAGDASKAAGSCVMTGAALLLEAARVVALEPSAGENSWGLLACCWDLQSVFQPPCMLCLLC